MGDCAQLTWMYKWWNVICYISLIGLAYKFFFFIYIFIAAMHASILISFRHSSGVIALFRITHCFFVEKTKVIVEIDSALYNAHECGMNVC